MSDFTPFQDAELTATELLMIQNLAAMAAAGANQFLRKLSATTFEQSEPSSSGISSVSLLSESALEVANGTRTTFSFTHAVGLVELNGLAQFVGGNLASATTYTVTFNSAPFGGDEIKNIYASS